MSNLILTVFDNMSVERLPRVTSLERTIVKMMGNPHFSVKFYTFNPSMTALKKLEFSSVSHLEFYILFIWMLRVLRILRFCLGWVFCLFV